MEASLFIVSHFFAGAHPPLPEFFGQCRREALAEVVKLPAIAILPEIMPLAWPIREKIVFGTSLSGKNPPKFRSLKPITLSDGMIA
jgi:hypothetical protein